MDNPEVHEIYRIGMGAQVCGRVLKVKSAQVIKARRALIVQGNDIVKIAYG
jgi:hypothetical protein